MTRSRQGRAKKERTQRAKMRKEKGAPKGAFSNSRNEGGKLVPNDQRFENWKDRRALALPYFLRSTTRESRVRKPPFFSTPRSSGS